MTWKMFLDDERFPKEDGFAIVRTVGEAKAKLKYWGCPNFISFDHDLGEGHLDAIEFAKYLIEMDIQHGILPDDFGFRVHSANIIGGKNIEMLLDNYLKFKKENHV